MLHLSRGVRQRYYHCLWSTTEAVSPSTSSPHNHLRWILQESDTFPGQEPLPMVGSRHTRRPNPTPNVTLTLTLPQPQKPAAETEQKPSVLFRNVPSCGPRFSPERTSGLTFPGYLQYTTAARSIWTGANGNGIHDVLSLCEVACFLRLNLSLATSCFSSPLTSSLWEF